MPRFQTHCSALGVKDDGEDEDKPPFWPMKPLSAPQSRAHRRGLLLGPWTSKGNHLAKVGSFSYIIFAPKMPALRFRVKICLNLPLKCISKCETLSFISITWLHKTNPTSSINLVEHLNFWWLWWLFTLFCRILILSRNLRLKIWIRISQIQDKNESISHKK